MAPVRPRAAALVLVLGLALVGPSRASAAVDSDAIRAAIAAYDGLEYERAIELLTPLLSASQAQSLTREEKVAALRTLAFAQFALGREDATRLAFEQLLRVDGAHQLDRRLTPRLRALFEETRARLATQLGAPRAPEGLPLLPVTVEPASLVAGRPATLRVAQTPRAAATVSIYHRSGEARGYTLLPARPAADGYLAALSPETVRAPALEYYLVAVDPAGVPFAGAGSLGDPIRLSVAPAPRPIYKRAWFWATIGGVVAAGAIAATLAVVLTPEPPASVTLSPH